MNPNLLNQTAQNQAPVKKPFNAKRIFVVLSALILLEVVWSVWSLSKNQLKQQNITSPPAQASPVAEKPRVSSAVLALQTGSLQVEVGQEIPVDIVLDTDGALVDGVDAIVSFDSALLKVEPVEVSGKSVPVKVGTLFNDYPQNALEDGKITLSGISDSTGYSGKGILGTVVFKAVKQGSASVKIEYSPDDTTESNVVLSGAAKDILGNVLDLALDIKPK